MSTAPDHETEPDHESEASGAIPRLSTKTWVLVGIGIAAMTAVAAWFGLHQASEPVRWSDVGYSIDSTTEATTTFDVYLYTDQSATCHVHALATDFAEVGVAEIVVDPADGKQQRVTVPITTVQPATTAVVRYCEAN